MLYFLCAHRSLFDFKFAATRIHYPSPPSSSLFFHDPSSFLPSHTALFTSFSSYTSPFLTHYSISIIFYIGGVNVLSHSMVSLRDVWENTSFALEGRQCDSACVVQERSGLMTRNGPTYKVGYGGISRM